MDPFVFALVVVMGGAAAVASRLRRASPGGDASRRAPASTSVGDSGSAGDGSVRVGVVLTYLDDEYWLAGELAVVREGAPAVRLFSAPDRGREQWVALPRDGRSLWVLYVDPELGAMGWPGIEVPTGGGRVLRRFEHGDAALVPSGEVTAEWEGLGRFALYRGHDTVAVVVEGPAKDRLALVGREIPWQLVQKLG
jgi:hypothetical protein